MKLPKILLIVLVGLLLASPLALADTINLGGGTWQTMVAPDNNGNPFWDNPSNDAQGNVGVVLPGLGGFPGAGGGEYLSTGPAANGVVNNVTFNGAGGGQSETLLLEVAGNAGGNALYAYNVANPSQTTQIFTGAEAAGTAKQVDIPYAQYGFLLVGPGGTFYSGTGASSDTNSNFAFFQDPSLANTWWVGAEDLTAGNGEGIGDFNDMVFKVSAVPIPGTALLLGTGLLGLALLGRRRRLKE